MLYVKVDIETVSVATSSQDDNMSFTKRCSFCGIELLYGELYGPVAGTQWCGICLVNLNRRHKETIKDLRRTIKILRKQLKGKS